MESQNTRVKVPALSGILGGAPSQRNLAHDVSSPNPSGRVDTDVSRMENPNTLLRCSKPLNITTYNPRTLLREHNLRELVFSASIHQQEIVCMHRFIHDEELSFSKPSPDYTLITSSSWKNSTNAAQGGVGVLLSKKAYKAYISAEKISSRVLVSRDRL